MEKKEFAVRRFAVTGIVVMLAGCLCSACGGSRTERRDGEYAEQAAGENVNGRNGTDEQKKTDENEGIKGIKGIRGNRGKDGDGTEQTDADGQEADRSVSEEEPDWKDEKVKEAVYSALGYGDGEAPDRAEFARLEWLGITDAGEVETFRDLSSLSNLKGLSLSYRGEDAVSIDLDTTMAPKLEELEISGCNLDGNELLGRLSGFPQLTNLYLTRCGIEDVSFLEGLPQITHLSFYGNEITDISPMASCRELVEISLAYNHIRDIRVIKELEKLEELGIHGNEISSLEPLRGLRNLKGINVTSNRITDLSPLEDSVRLEALGAGDNQITDIAPLKKLTRLYNLALDYNEIEDISALEQMKEMNWLGLSNNRIGDFGPITGMEQLFFLSVYNNPDRNIGKLAFYVPELYLGTADTEYCPADKKEALEEAQQWLDKLYPEDGIRAEDVTFGDLNGDGAEDMAVTGASEVSEEEPELTGDAYRKIYVLLREGEDSFLPVEPVETLASWMGGIYGDPYQGICISDGKLVEETYGGSNWRWGFRHVYAYENGQMEEKMTIELEHFVYTDGYSWSITDCATGNRKNYVITGSMEGRMKKLLVADSADLAQAESAMGECRKVLGQMEKEKGVKLPETGFYDCLPEIAAGGEPYGYIAHDPLYETEEETASVLEKAAGEFLTGAAALPVTAYTSEKMKENYDILAGVSVPEVFYIGWADGKAVRLSYKNLLSDGNGAFVHGISWEEAEGEEGWKETAVVYYEEETGVFRRDVLGSS